MKRSKVAGEGQRPAARGSAGGELRLTRRNLKFAALTDILEWLGQERAEGAMSRKEALCRLMWQRALDGNVTATRLLFDYMAVKAAQLLTVELPVQPMLPFTADEAAQAARGLEGNEEGGGVTG